MRLLRFAVLSVVLALVGATAVAVANPASSSPVSDPNSLPIIQIHGFDSQDCPGSDASYGWVPLNHVLHRSGWTGSLLPVSFYACDSNGADITGYDADTPAEIGTQLTPGTPRAGYRQDTPFTTIARDLAWYIYRNFSAVGQPVDIVALSMGGLIARAALYRVRIGDPTFPPLLRVAQAITFSTPHRGVGTMASNGEDPGCHHMVQCEEWGSDSPLLTELMRDGTDPQGAGGTQWTLIGSSAGCDFLPLASALGMPKALQIDLTAPCYSHIGYFWDIEPEHTATAVIKTGADATPVTISNAPHSLTLATILLQNPRPTETPTPTPTTSTPTPTPTPSTSTPAPEPAAAVVTALPAVTTTPAVSVQYRSAVADGSPTFDLQYRTAVGTAAPSAWTAPASLQGLPAGTSSLVPPKGTTEYCVAARGRDGTAVSAWGTPTCTAIPIDDRALTRSSAWTAVTETGSYAGTLSRATVKDAVASVSVFGRGIAVVATTCATCGSLQVSVGGKVWRTISTRSSATVRRVVLTVPAWSSTGTTAAVTLRTTSTSPVHLDGVAALR